MQREIQFLHGKRRTTLWSTTLCLLLKLLSLVPAVPHGSLSSSSCCHVTCSVSGLREEASTSWMCPASR